MLRKFSLILMLGIWGTSAAALTAKPNPTLTSTPNLSLTLSSRSTPITYVNTNSPAMATGTGNTIPIKTATMTAATATTAATTAATTTPTPAPNAPLDTKTIDTIMGVRGKLDAQTQTYRVIVPRNDLNIILNGVKLTPSMGLTSWAAFKKTQNITTLKADIVVTENQANTILSLALDNNLAVIALHNHLLWESPRVMFIHVEGAGDEKTLAEAIKKVFAKTQDTEDEASDFPLAAIDAADTTLNPEKIDNIFGARGNMRDGAYHIQLSKVSDADKSKVKNKIINATATFAGSDSEAVVDGDISMRAADLHSVLKSLHKVGIAIVALHQHESNNDETRMVYLHYFGVGQTNTLAKGLRSALEAAKTNDKAVTAQAVALQKTPAPAPVAATAQTPAKPIQAATVIKPEPVANGKAPEPAVLSNPSVSLNKTKAPQTVAQAKTSTITSFKMPAKIATPIAVAKKTEPATTVKAPQTVAQAKTPVTTPFKMPMKVAAAKKVSPTLITEKKSAPSMAVKNPQTLAQVKKAATTPVVKAPEHIAATKTGAPVALVKTPMPAAKVKTPQTLAQSKAPITTPARTPVKVTAAKTVTPPPSIKAPQTVAQTKTTAATPNKASVQMAAAKIAALMALEKKSAQAANKAPATTPVKPVHVATAKLTAQDVLANTPAAQAKSQKTLAQAKTKAQTTLPFISPPEFSGAPKPVTVALVKTKPIAKAATQVVAVKTAPVKKPQTVAQSKPQMMPLISPPEFSGTPKAVAPTLAKTSTKTPVVKTPTHVAQVKTPAHVAQAKTSATKTKAVALGKKPAHMPQIRTPADSKRLVDEAAASVAKREPV